MITEREMRLLPADELVGISGKIQYLVTFSSYFVQYLQRRVRQNRLEMKLESGFWSAELSGNHHTWWLFFGQKAWWLRDQEACNPFLKQLVRKATTLLTNSYLLPHNLPPLLHEQQYLTHTTWLQTIEQKYKQKRQSMSLFLLCFNSASRVEWDRFDEDHIEAMQWLRKVVKLHSAARFACLTPPLNNFPPTIHPPPSLPTTMLISTGATKYSRVSNGCDCEWYIMWFERTNAP